MCVSSVLIAIKNKKITELWKMKIWAEPETAGDIGNRSQLFEQGRSYFGNTGVEK